VYGDDGVGVCLAYTLPRCCRTKGVDVVWVDRPTIGDIALLEGYEVVVIIDAIDYSSMSVFGLGPKAAVAVIELDPARLDVSDVVGLVDSADAHTMDPAYLVSLAYSAGLFEGVAYLVAVSVRDTEFGKGLSEEAKANALKALIELEKIVATKHRATLRCDYGCVKSTLDNLCCNPLASL
jgi:hydrogenase maturation protease